MSDTSVSDSAEAARDARRIETIRFPGPVPYREAHRLQIERRKAVEEGRQGNCLFLLEHPPVLTLGRDAEAEHILCSRADLGGMGIEVCDVERGGDVTYHGPGQLVAYPILDLGQWKKSIGWYLRSLEEVLVRVLAGYGLKGERMDGYTGVWVDGAKIAAIGVAIHHWTTFHGAALNVNPNMAHFDVIVPCGIPDKPVTSMETLLGEPPAMGDVMDRFEGHFRDLFCG